MNNKQQDNWADCPDSVPPLLSIFKPVEKDHVEWIVPNVLGFIKIDVMLGKVFSSFFFVPLKLHIRFSTAIMYA